MLIQNLIPPYRHSNPIFNIKTHFLYFPDNRMFLTRSYEGESEDRLRKNAPINVLRFSSKGRELVGNSYFFFYCLAI